MKKVAKIFGGFRYFLYLCSIIKSGNQPPGHNKKRESATRCSWLT